MHNDESIWACVNQGFCSYKVVMKQPKQNFCRNQYNVTGLCNRVSCPLANSQYGTIIENEGVCYLYLKTVERAHSPKNLWEKVKLSRNYLEALEQVSQHMLHWPEHQINRCKQRLTRIRQTIIRMRKMSMKEGPKLVTIKKKTERREATRELKAEAAAKVDLAIERELLERLKQGTYGDIYNFNKKSFDAMLEKEEEEEAEVEDEEDGEFIEDLDDDEQSDVDEEELERQAELEMEADAAADAAFDVEDLTFGAMGRGPPAKRRKGLALPRVELEYEDELA